MSLTRLDNLYSSKTGKYLYVSPDDFNASDTLDNRGNSPLRPFKTIQRAFIEVARFSYKPGANNDRFDQFSIMLMPGDHYIDNRPGLVNYNIGGNNQDRNRYYDAGNLIELNKRFIAYEAYAKMLDNNSEFSPSSQFTSTFIENILDTLDAVIYNTKFGGNDKTFDASLVYQNNPSLVGNEQAEAIEVYQYVTDLASSVIKNLPITQLYQSAYLSELNIQSPFTQVFDPSISSGPSIYGENTPDVPYGQAETCADVESTIRTLFTLIEDGINENLNLEDRQEPETFGELPIFNFDQTAGQWKDNSVIDLSNPDNIYWKFNASTGGAIVPRGCSLVGYDLRRTVVRPLYVPDPADSNQKRTSIFNLTGGCYLWQFTIKDGDLSENSPLYNSEDRVGKVYFQKGNVTNLAVPEYSHHKICIMEYAELPELDEYYKKVGIAFSRYQPTIDDEGEFDALIQENRIVGPLSDTRFVETIKVTDIAIGQPNQRLVVEVKTTIDHGYFKDQYVAILNTGLDEELNGTFKIATISQTDTKIFTYEIPGKVAAAFGLVNNQTYGVGSGLNSNAVVQAEIDSVESASPYVFNCSIRSTWGQCGMWADGSKATGFRSMVVAQYTGVSLQKDDRAFIRYDEFTNTWNQASLRDAFATVPYHTKGDAYWKDDWRNFHIRASDDSFIQCVSVFAVGFFDHFLMESGGDMSITNSNSNFGNTSLHAVGYKGFAFNQDRGGYITDIIPPQEISGGYSINPNIPSTNSQKIPYYPIDIVSSNDPDNKTKLFLGSDDVYDPASRPAATLNGFRIGARPDERLFVKLEEEIPGSGDSFYSTLTPSGVTRYDVFIDFLNPTGISINQKAQDAANSINSNKEFIQDEVYGYITTKYPQLLTNTEISIEICKRDIGYYVDSVVQDLKLGGNINTIQSAEAYFVGGQLTYIQNERDQTIDALGVTRDLCIAAMRNWNYVLTGCSSVANSDIISVPSTQGLVVGMKVTSYNTLDPSNNTLPTGNPSLTIPQDTYIVEIIDDTTIRIGEKGQYIFGLYSFDPSPSDRFATQTITASGPGTGLFLDFTLRDETVLTSQNNIVAVRDGIFSTIRTVYDDTLVQDSVSITSGQTECGDVASVISQYFVDIATILSSPFGQDGVERIEPNTDFSALSKRATIFSLTVENPHEMETGTVVRLVPKPAPGKNPDPRVVRLPKGFSTNTKYYVINPGRRTSPEDYSNTTAFNSENQSVFMLASTLENARAGNYIYSPETEAIDRDIIIEVQKYVLDQSYDLYQYSASVAVDAGSGVIKTDLSHSFDIPSDGLEPQKVFLRQINPDTSLPSKTVNIGSNIFQIPVSPQDEFFARYISNNLFAIYNTFEDSRDDVNRVTLIGNQKFLVFANKRFSPLKFDPKPISYGVTTSTTGQWYLQVKDETELSTNIVRRITKPEDTTYSGSSPAASRSNDTFFERVRDSRVPEDRIYKLRYVIPRYLETVRDPLNGFVIKVRTDTQRRLRPQKLVLKPVNSANHSPDESWTSASVATFVNNGTFDTTGQFTNNAEKLGRNIVSYDSQSITPVYDPYINPKIVETKTGKLSFVIQSAKVTTQRRFESGENIDYKYLEVVAFDHSLRNEAIKNESFIVVQIDAPDGIGFVSNATQNIQSNLIQWSGFSSGTGYLHGYFTTSTPSTRPKSVDVQRYYLIIKGVISGQIEYNSLLPTTFFQGGDSPSNALVTAKLIAKPDSVGDSNGKSKSNKKDYLYATQGANLYTLVPGDVITDDSGNDFYIDTVEDVGEIEDTFYVFGIQELKQRIPGQQDGIYYLSCLKANISPFPTGPGVGKNFRNFKFSQPISFLYPQDYKNDPLWFKGIDQQLNDPPASYSAADNYVHGLVTINDAKFSETKEVIVNLIKNPILDEYEYTEKIESIDNGDETFTEIQVDARIRAQQGNAVSGAEDRKIPIKGTSLYPTDSRLYVELRRPSIARSGNHTFEYLGFGPGNYSTGFPLRQEVILTDKQDFYAQAKREDGGIVFYTGLNSNGDLYIGNKKINAITGEETFLESAELIGSEDEDDDVGSTLVTTFESPVTFNNKINVNGVASFTKPVTIQVDAIDTIAPNVSLRIQSLVDSVNLGEDISLSRNSFSNRALGDITLSKNRIQSAIYGINPRGSTTFSGQAYSVRTHLMSEGGIPRPSNITPEQSLAVYNPTSTQTLTSNKLFSNQSVNYGNLFNIPVPGDILLKGKEVGRSGSIGWIFANTFLDIPNNIINTFATPKLNQIGELVVGQGTGDGFTATNLLRLEWSQQNGSQITNSDILRDYGLTINSFVRIVGLTGDLADIANGTFAINRDTFVSGGSFIDLVLNSNIASVDILSSWEDTQTNATVSVSSSSWKEYGVIGAEAIRTETTSLGSYKVGINTVSRSDHNAYLNSFVDSVTTDPKANLDVVGNAFISGTTDEFIDAFGRTISEYKSQSNASLRTKRSINNAFLVGGDAYFPNNIATLRVATSTGRIGVNLTNSQLNGAESAGIFNRALGVFGGATISGNVRFERNLEVNGAATDSYTGSYGTASLSSRSTTFNLLDTGANNSVNTLNFGGSIRTVSMFNNTQLSQTINIGTNAATSVEVPSSTLFNLHTNSINSTINLGTVSNAIGNVSRITIGGAINTRNNSEFLIRNFRTVVSGKLILRGGGSDTNNVGFIETEGVNQVNMFPEGVTTLNIGDRAGILNLGGSAGNTTIRNNLRVSGSATIESDITLNGGRKNTNIGISRNQFGQISVAQISRTNNVVTLQTIGNHNIASSDTIEILTSDESFNPATELSGSLGQFTASGNTIQYTNVGPNVATKPATGTVLRVGIGRQQAVGDEESANFNVDFYSVLPDISPSFAIQNLISNKLIIDNNRFTESDPVKFLNVGNLNGVNVATTYYVYTADSSGITIATAPGGVSGPGQIVNISLLAGQTGVGNARIILGFSSIDTVGDLPWGGQSFNNGDGTYRLFLNSPLGFSANRFYLINKEIVFSTTEPSPSRPYFIDVQRAVDGTALVEHPDGTAISGLFKQSSATYITNVLSATSTSLFVSEFSATIKEGDLFRLNPGTSSQEFVRITDVNVGNAQQLVVNDGNFGSEVQPLVPLQLFKVISTTGNTRVIGDLTIGYDSADTLDNDSENTQRISDRTQRSSSVATSGTIEGTGGGNLRVHNSIELFGNTNTTIPGRQYFVITNGSRPKLFVESSSGNTSLYEGANFRIYSDSFYSGNQWSKTAVDIASNVRFSVSGTSGNTDIAGTLRVRNTFNIGTLQNPLEAEAFNNVFTSRFSVNAANGSTTVGNRLTINGQASTNPSRETSIFTVQNLGVIGGTDSNPKPFSINQDASIDAFGETNFYNRNGGRKLVFVSAQGNTDTTAVQLKSNLVYAVRPTSTLILKLPETAISGDMVRIIDVGGALNFSVNLVIRSLANIQNERGGTDLGRSSGDLWQGGELVVNTPNAAFGLIFVGNVDSDGNGVPGPNQGWYLAEI